MKYFEKTKEFPEINDGDNSSFQIRNLILIRSHLRRITKKLIVLKMLKSDNRRIKCLCMLVNKYRKMLALAGPLDASTSYAGRLTVERNILSAITENPPMPIEDVVAESVMDIVDYIVSIEAKTNKEIKESSSSELNKALCLKGLPQRFRMPAPRVLCRPSPLRRVKPCCTRSCSESLEHVVTICYNKNPKLHPEFQQHD